MTIQMHGGVGGRMGSRANRRRTRKKGLMSEINVTPMVDVMLVLLVIFMVTAPMMVTGVQVDLPETSAQSMTADDEPLAVSVQKDGSIFINKMKVPLDELAPKLEAITAAKRKKETRIFVRGDKGTNYGSVITVLAHIHKAGFKKVGLETDSVPN